MEQETAALPQHLECWQETLHWQPNPLQQQQFQHLYAQTLQGNRQLNLTRITEPEAFWEKHLWDSLSGIKPWLAASEPEAAESVLQTLPPNLSPNLPSTLPPNCRSIDVGTGAGFPGLPIALVQPSWTVTLLDSTRKKMAFVETMLAELDIKNAKTLSDRVEEAAHHPRHRAAYDLATLRAVAAAAACAEYALPLLKVGGIAVLYRGQWIEEEAIALEAALQVLGGRLVAVEAFKTPISQSDRHCLYLKKEKPTSPEFPRPTGIPTRVPLA